MNSEISLPDYFARNFLLLCVMIAKKLSEMGEDSSRWLKLELFCVRAFVNVFPREMKSNLLQANDDDTTMLTFSTI